MRLRGREIFRQRKQWQALAFQFVQESSILSMKAEEAKKD